MKLWHVKGIDVEILRRLLHEGYIDTEEIKNMEIEAVIDLFFDMLDSNIPDPYNLIDSYKFDVTGMLNEAIELKCTLDNLNAQDMIHDTVGLTNIMSMSVWDIGLRALVATNLQRTGINTVYDICYLSGEHYLKLNRGSRVEIERFLLVHNSWFNNPEIIILNQSTGKNSKEIQKDRGTMHQRIVDKIKKFCNSIPGSGFEFNYLDKAREVYNLYNQFWGLLDEDNQENEETIRLKLIVLDKALDWCL